MKIPIPDPRQYGSDTRDRFHFQDCVVALEAIRRIATGDLECFYVEYAREDVVFVPSDGPMEFTSIKSRQPHQRGSAAWTWAELRKGHILRDLHRAWSDHNESITVAFLSNAGLEREAAGIVDWTGQSPSDMGIATKLSGDLGIEEDEARRFLAALTVPRDRLPDLDHIESVLDSRIKDLLDSRGIPVSDIAIARDDVIGFIRDKSTGDPRKERLEATLHRSRQKENSVLRNRRRITADELIELLIQSCKPGRDPVPAPVRRFVGRAVALDTLYRGFSSDRRRPVVIHGAPGVGATSVALQFAESLGNSIKIIYIDGSSMSALRTNLRRAFPGIALPGEPPPSFGLPSTDTNEVVIIDNLADAHWGRALVAGRTDAFVLITGHHADLGSGCDYIPLSEWDAEELALFIESTWPILSVDERRLIEDRIGRHPLAWAQAADTVRLLTMTAEEWCDRFDQAPLPTLEIGRAEMYPSNVVTAIRMSIDALEVIDPQALDLLRLVSVLNSGTASLSRVLDAWPEELFDQARIIALLGKGDYLTRRDKAHPDSDRVIEAATRMRFAATTHLATTSLIRRLDGTILINRVVGCIVQALIPDRRPYLEVAAGLVSLPFTHARGDAQIDLAELLPAASSVLVHCHAENLLGPAYYLIALGYAETFAELGLKDDAWAWAQVGYAWVKRINRSLSNEQIADFDSQFGRAAMLTGHLDEAQTAFLKVVNWAVAGSRRDRMLVQGVRWLSMLILNRPDTGIADYCLHLVGETAGRWETLDAPDRAILALSAARASFALDRPDSVESWIATARHEATLGEFPGLEAEINSFASSFFRFTDPSQGEAAAELALARFKETTRPALRNTAAFAVVLACKADDLVSANTPTSLQRARTVLDEAVVILNEYAPKDAVSRARVDVVRARLWLHIANGCWHPVEAFEAFSQAKQGFDEAIPILREYAGADDKDFAAVLVNYAMTLGNLGDGTAAVAAAHEAYALDVRRHGLEHMETKQTALALKVLRDRFGIIHS